MKKTVIGVLVAILCCVGIYKITQLPPGLTYDLRGTYTEDLPEGAVSFTYLSVEDHDFHYFNERADVFLYGTYEKVADDQWILRGKHIEEQTVTLTKDFTFVLQLDGQEIPMKKIADHATIINNSKEKAIENDGK
ncbi:hypothetical protein [Anaerotignum sp.]